MQRDHEIRLGRPGRRVGDLGLDHGEDHPGSSHAVGGQPAGGGALGIALDQRDVTGPALRRQDQFGREQADVGLARRRVDDVEGPVAASRADHAVDLRQ